MALFSVGKIPTGSKKHPFDLRRAGIVKIAMEHKQTLNWFIKICRWISKQLQKFR